MTGLGNFKARGVVTLDHERQQKLLEIEGTEHGKWAVCSFSRERGSYNLVNKEF